MSLPPVTFAKTSTGHLLFLPLGPSNNDRMIPVIFRRRPRMILSTKARNYISRMTIHLRKWMTKSGFKAIDDYRKVKVWVILPKRGADCHNYDKCVFDAMKNAGVVADDCYILPDFAGIYHDAKEPLFIVSL